jgi:glycosyltransferase involved in cell wall biosynthesis
MKAYVDPTRSAEVAVVIPCYRVAEHIADVIRGIPPAVQCIVCVDDCSPDNSAEVILAVGDPRVVLVRHAVNQGVGGAMVTGFRECLERDIDIVVKMDGDGQMDPAYLDSLLAPLIKGEADYAKGNRWHHTDELTAMPVVRRVGNLGLSFLTKAASGYWQMFDPCNGYLAIRTSVLRHLRLDALARDYFFETSMLVQLNVIRAKVVDVPMAAKYGDETSSMRLGRILRRFPTALARAFALRLWRRHFIRDFGPVALFLLSGMMLMTIGTVFGAWHWVRSVLLGQPATAGTVMLSAMPVFAGFQFLLHAVVLDIGDQPQEALCRNAPLLESPLTHPPQVSQWAA